MRIGVDEVGRGALAGPVVAAAAFCLSPLPAQIRDSKTLSARQRQRCMEVIRRHCRVGIAMQGVRAIEQTNIRRATLLAMEQAVAQLLGSLCAHPPQRPPSQDFAGDSFEIIVDGRDALPHLPSVPNGFTIRSNSALIKADQRIPEVAAASIAAKVFRDDYMARLGALAPAYLWHKNAAYGTLAHRRAVGEQGRTPWHRATFSISLNTLALPDA